MRKWLAGSWCGYRPGRLGQNTMLGTAGLGARAVIQAIYLLVVSRWLGAEGYGLFAGTVALTILAAPLANWGSALLLTRHVANDRSRSRAMWATALVQTGVMGSVLVFCVLMLAAFAVPQRLPMLPLLLLALSELILLPAALAANSQCYALERGVASAVSVCLVPLGRLAAMLAAIACQMDGTPTQAAVAHFIGSVLGLAAAFAVVIGIDGLPAWRGRLPLRDAIRQGTPYAVSNVAGTSYQEVDKVLMLQLLGAAAVGPYTVAFRVASIFLMPVVALISASLPRMMAQVGDGENARTYRAVLLSGMGYGLLAGAGMLLAAPWLPRIFGAEYAPASYYLRLLAVWPLLYAIRHCLAAHMTANYRQAMRSWVETVGLGIVVLLNFTLLPRIGAAGSVASLLATEVLVIVAMWLLTRQQGGGDSRKGKQVRE